MILRESHAEGLHAARDSVMKAIEAISEVVGDHPISGILQMDLQRLNETLCQHQLELRLLESNVRMDIRDGKQLA